MSRHLPTIPRLRPPRPTSTLVRRPPGAFTRLSLWAFACLLSAAFAPVQAVTHLLLSAPGKAHNVKVEQAFEYMPDNGFMPLRVTVTNPYAEESVWTLVNQMQKDTHVYNNQVSTDWQQRLTVPAGEIRTFDILYPVISGRRAWYNDRHLIVRGSGHEDRFTIQSSRDNRRRGYDSGTFGLASEQLRLKYGEQIAPYLDNLPEQSLNSGSTRIYFFPKDWRGYAGVHVLWFQQSDWEGLPADARLPILQWVAQGGDLRILKDANVDDEAAVSGLPAGGTGLIAHGAGLVRVYPHLSAEELFQYPPPVGENTATEDRVYYSERTARIYDALQSPFWVNNGAKQGISTAMPELRSVPLEMHYNALLPNALLTTLLALAIAVLLGPLNLWVFARGRKRYRLLITTPALSLLLCAGISAFILLDDGIGGEGVYARLFLLPGDQQEVVLTVQSSRTGLLLKRGFTVPEGAWLTPSPNANGERFTEPRALYGLHADAAWGSWFGSRRVQNQMLEQIRPSRSGFEVRAKDGGLYVVSSFPALCPQLYFIGADEAAYRADNVVTGRPAPLTPVSFEEFSVWLATTEARLGVAISQRIGRIDSRRPNQIYASVADYSGSAPLATPGAIDWQPYESLVIASANLGADAAASNGANREDAQ